ncbi:MAG: hypothetical protein OXH79_06135 [Boseongicola sp.]|nr:hypothetical protein [Boseongicola sp.]
MTNLQVTFLLHWLQRLLPVVYGPYPLLEVAPRRAGATHEESAVRHPSAVPPFQPLVPLERVRAENLPLRAAHSVPTTPHASNRFRQR